MSNRPLQECTVADAMSSDVCSCGASDSVEAAQSLDAIAPCVRRLPVIDGDRHLIGIPSLNDLALHVRDRRDVGVPAEAVAATLTSVSVHGQPQGG
jgi:CBS-domain-containing membrane protein